MIGLLMCLVLAAVVMVPLSWAADAPAMLVGRIYDIERDLLRYVPEKNDWVAVVRDAPKRSDTVIKPKSPFGYLFTDLYKGWQIQSDVNNAHYGVRLTRSW